MPSTSSLPLARTVLITGASSGIGQQLCQILAQQGHQVLALARRDAPLQQLASQHASIVPIVADLADTAALPTLAHRLQQAHPELAVVVHNAGVQHNHGLLSSATGVDLLTELNTNLLAPMRLTQLLLPQLLTQHAPQLVFVGSSLAFVPKRSAAAYSASKAGIHGFCGALRAQVPREQLVVTEVVLPLVDTPMTAGRGEGKISAAEAAHAIARTLQQRPDTAWAGQAKALRVLLRLAPSLAARLLQGPTPTSGANTLLH